MTRDSGQGPTLTATVTTLLAGVSIALPLAGQQTTVVAAPLYEIGSSFSDPNDQLGDVVDLAMLPGGGVAILDRLATAVRVYDAGGRFVRNIGRSGQGPGEFVDPIDLAWVDPEIVVLDRSGRTNRFSVDGSVVSTRQSATPAVDEDFNPNPDLVLADGRVLFRANQRLFGRVQGEYRQKAQLIVEGEPALNLGTFPADTGRADTSGQPIPRPYIPGDRLLVATDDSTVVIADPHGLVRVLTSDGMERNRFETGLRRPPATPGDVETQTSAALSSLAGANDRRVVSEWLDGMPRTDRAPPIRGLLIGADDSIWVEAWERASSPEGPRGRWIQYDRSGERQSELLAPLGLTVFQFGDGALAGVLTDALGVQRVRVYPIG